MLSTDTQDALRSLERQVNEYRSRFASGFAVAGDPMCTISLAAATTILTALRSPVERGEGEGLAELREQLARGEASDGYHTHRELYEYRMLYNAHAARGWLAAGIPVVKSWCHSDGELCFGGGWFIVVASLPTGQVSNHYREEHWNLFDVPEVERPPIYDGHTPEDAATRLRASLASPPAPVERGEGEVGEAFYRLTVQQRDAAWREVEMLRARLDKLASLTNRYLNALANGEEDEGKYHELYNMAHRIVQFGPASPPAPDADWMWQELKAARDVLSENYWLWQGDGEDHLESLTCPVVIRPEVLARLLAASAAPVEGERERLVEEITQVAFSAYSMGAASDEPDDVVVSLRRMARECVGRILAALPVQGEPGAAGRALAPLIGAFPEIPLPCARCGEAVCECPEEPGDPEGLLASYFAGAADARRDMRDLLAAALEWRERWADGASEGHSPEIDAAYRAACDALFEALRPFAPSTNSLRISTSAPAPPPEEREAIAKVIAGHMWPGVAWDHREMDRAGFLDCADKVLAALNATRTPTPEEPHD